MSNCKIPIPGDPNFPLNNLYSKPKSPIEADELRSYMLQMRQECASRLLKLVWPQNDNQPLKWWICFAKRKFINISLNEVRLY